MASKPLLTPEQDQIARDLYLSGYSLIAVGAYFGLSRKAALNSLKRTGTKIRGFGAPGKKNHFWNGGRVIDNDGYVLIHSPDHPYVTKGGYVREHRLVVEKHLGRYLNPKEVVHHKNGIPDDNRIENLAVFSDNSQHLAVTLLGKQPKHSKEGLARMSQAAETRRGKTHKSPVPKGSGVQTLRRKILGQFLQETSGLSDTELEVKLPQLPNYPKRSKKKR